MSPEERDALRVAVNARRREAEGVDDLPDALPAFGVRRARTGRTPTPSHGTELAYVYYRCRCDSCREASSASRRARRRRLAERESRVCQFCAYPTDHPSHTCPAHRDLAPPIEGLDAPYADELHSSSDGERS